MKKTSPSVSVFVVFLFLCSLVTSSAVRGAEVARIGSQSYSTLTAAYAASVSGDVIKTLNTVMPDNGLNINSSVLGGGKNVSIKGGYQADFSETARTAFPTVITGTIIISSGTLKVDRLAIRSRQSQSISGFNPPATVTYGDTAITLAATATSGLPVTFKVVSGAAKVTGNLLTITGAGVIDIMASQAGNSSYNAAVDVHATITVSPASQNIIFSTLSTAYLGSSDVNPGATSNSGLQVSYASSNQLVATIINGQIHPVGVGQAVITATQAGNSNFQAATPVEQSLNVALPLSPVVSGALEGYWPLDGNWQDLTGRHNLISRGVDSFVSAPLVRQWNNSAYGPGSVTIGTGATNSAFSSVSEDNGITLEGWAWLENDSTSGVLFGFWAPDYNAPKMSLGVSGGHVWLELGGGNTGTTAKYTRIGDNTCWHHIALVLPKGFRTGIPYRVYIDGIKTEPVLLNSSATGGACLSGGATLSGSPFTIGMFDNSGGQMRVDEVRVWRRELADNELTVLSTPVSADSTCTNAPPPNWAPGPRFVPPLQPPVPVVDLGVHVLTDNTIAIVTDPNPWLRARIAVDSGPFLTAMEQNRQYVAVWTAAAHYNYAAKEVITHYRPPILSALSVAGHFTIAASGSVPTALPQGSLWPQVTREFRMRDFSGNNTEIHTDSAENVFYSYITLPFSMQAGETYHITDTWGNTTSFVFDLNQTVSWALKVNQVGYLADAARKYAYLGSWMGPAGALSATRFNGAPFELRRESDHTTAFTGVVTHRKDESVPLWNMAEAKWFTLSGEDVYELDFSTFTAPGRYYISVAGVGRSWSFEIGQNALGEAFYTHMRGLYHQRCAPLDVTYTPWSRGDLHHPMYQAAFPPLLEDYSDHSSDGWGFLDANGAYRYCGNWDCDQYAAPAATKTQEIIPGLQGGWHDAGDFDQPNSLHLYGVRDLVMSYLMFPDNFTDGQLNIPESGNGIPDIIDEAVWGMEIERLGQKADGRVGLWIINDGTAVSIDPGKDTTPYYLSLGTRNSSMKYAEYAALLARGLQRAGVTDKAALYLDSAKRAYAFATSTYDRYPRVSQAMKLLGNDVVWYEQPTIPVEYTLRALIQLWLASGDQTYYSALNTAQMADYFHAEALSLTWRTNAFELMDVALMPDKFPDNWGQMARDALISSADGWKQWMEADAYRRVWYRPNEGYFLANALGVAQHNHLRNLVAAWKLTNDASYRTAALLGMDWLQGANPQGRSYTTGLGKNYVTHPLHAPSDIDGVADPVPGITIYGVNSSVSWVAPFRVYGLFDPADPGMDFNGSALAQLPPPWNDTMMSSNSISSVLDSVIPFWRRIISMESANPLQMEFTVEETISQAAAVAGCLLGPGWMPSESLKNRQPKSASELRDSLWYQP